MSEKINYSQAMIPHATFRWVVRPRIMDGQQWYHGTELITDKVLQQAFTNAAGGGFVWIDVPTVDETGASQ